MGLLAAGLVLAGAPVAGAQQASSPNYSVNEVYFGTGGELNACSTNYCSKQAAGETTVGNAASSNYQTQAGFNTSDTPLLEVNVNGGTYDMGVLDSTMAHTALVTFTVRNYLSNGYAIHLAGSAPTMTSGAATHTLPGLSSPTASNPGTEQFGVNLRANTSPSVGANIQQLPDSTFGFGAAAADYNIVNSFKFVNNDTIASSAKSSGTTLYTLSIIANIAAQTPAGQYTGNLNVVVVPTF